MVDLELGQFSRFGLFGQVWGKVGVLGVWLDLGILENLALIGSVLGQT